MAASVVRCWPGAHLRLGCAFRGAAERRIRPLGVIICDTGPLVAAALANDADHRACIDLFGTLHAAGSCWSPRQLSPRLVTCWAARPVRGLSPCSCAPWRTAIS